MQFGQHWSVWWQVCKNSHDTIWLWALTLLFLMWKSVVSKLSTSAEICLGNLHFMYFILVSLRYTKQTHYVFEILFQWIFFAFVIS